MDFTELTAYLDAIPTLGVPGCDMAIYQDHKQLYRHSAGFRDAEKTQPVKPDDTYWLFSCTKLFTTCAAMQLIERGLLSPDDPVSEYLPAYGHLTVREGDEVRPARRVMTVRHLMSMQSGLDYELDSPGIRAALARHGDQATTRQLVDAKAQDPLSFEPGTDFLYSLGHDVLAAVIEVISGLRFSDYLRQNLFEPLGLETIGFAVKDMRRQCAQFTRLEDGTLKSNPCDANNYMLAPRYESGGAGLVSDVKDYIAFVDALACGGMGANGARILSPEMIQLWSANQLGPAARRSFDLWNRKGYAYALGVRTRVDMTLGGRGQLGEFGWDGAAGAWTMVDPHNRLSAFFAMHVREFGEVYEVIHPTLRSLIYEGLK